MPTIHLMVHLTKKNGISTNVNYNWNLPRPNEYKQKEMLVLYAKYRLPFKPNTYPNRSSLLR